MSSSTTVNASDPPKSRRLSGSSSELRKTMAKYDSFQEQLWSRSRQAVAKRHRIEQLELGEIEGARSADEKEHLLALFALKRRVLDFQIQEMAIEISHVADVLQQLHVLAAEGERAVPAHCAFEVYSEWANSNQELYMLRSQTLAVVRENVRLRQQWQTQQAARDNTSPTSPSPGRQESSLLQKLQVALGELSLHTQTQPKEEPGDGQDETDGGHGSQRPSFQSILSGSLKENQSPQEKYLSGLFDPTTTNRTFESQKVREYIKECHRTSVTTATATTDGVTDERHLPAIHPLRYHDFMSTLSCYVVEKQRSLHSEGWREEDVQLVLEEHIMVSVRSLATTLCGHCSEDAAFKKKCSMLSAITQQQLGIKPQYISKELVPFCEAISLLKSIIFAVTPSKKLFCVAKAANAVFNQLVVEGVDTSMVNADVFIDIWAYVIIKAEIDNLISEVAFMAAYAVKSLSTGMAGYFLTSVEIATHAILEMDAERLLAVTDRVGHIVVCERQRYTDSPSGPVQFDCISHCQRLFGYSMCVVEEWVLNPVKFFSVVLIPSSSPDAFVDVAVIKLKLGTVTPAQAEFVQNVFLPKDVPGFEVQNTPLGMATVLTSPQDVKNLTLLPLDCQDFNNVDTALRQYITFQQLSVGCSSAHGDEVTATDSSKLRRPFQAAVVADLEVSFREKYNISETTSLQDGLEATIRTAQVLCQHLDFLSVVTPTNGVYSDLLSSAILSFKKFLLEEVPNVPDKYGSWSDDGRLTPGVLQAIKDYLRNVVEKLASLGFILPLNTDPCDTSAQAVRELRRTVAICQRSWHLPIHIEGTLGRKTRVEIDRRLHMLAQLREKANPL